VTDIAIIWDNDRFGGDLAIRRGALLTDEGLRTAILISLFSDARARPSDVLPEAGADRRGWWGDGFAETEGEGLGSLLWLLIREKNVPSVVARAREAALASLAWLTDAAIVSALDVTAEAQGFDRLAIGVSLARPDGPQRLQYDFVWNASTGALV
jgi:phage gp46-like protein